MWNNTVLGCSFHGQVQWIQKDTDALLKVGFLWNIMCAWAWEHHCLLTIITLEKVSVTVLLALLGGGFTIFVSVQRYTGIPCLAAGTTAVTINFHCPYCPRTFPTEAHSKAWAFVLLWNPTSVQCAAKCSQVEVCCKSMSVRKKEHTLVTSLEGHSALFVDTRGLLA